ncbi:hypothetical protein ACFPIJ_64000 [Dactylosporangium cerinum]|uniref:Knr4/Smi1-like domain-containing protein n=1 Tax=Dactylosporangium cerinum TaxID=1434730 RepID=A0ABV9WKN8_9ACTN
MTDIEHRLARIRRLFTRLRELNWPEAAPSPLDESAVERFEAGNGLRLPENYRRYLLEFGDVDTGLMALAAYGTPLARQAEADPFWRLNTSPFRLTRPWSGTPADLEEAREGMGEDADHLDPDDFYDIDGGPRDGTMHLGGTRSQLYAWLVLNGPFEGEVWVDSLGYAPDGWLAPAVDMLQEFVPDRWWHPLRDEPWFPAVEEPAGGPDFLDLTGDSLAQIVLRAEIRHALDADTARAVDQRLEYRERFDFRHLPHPGAQAPR